MQSLEAGAFQNWSCWQKLRVWIQSLAGMLVKNCSGYRKFEIDSYQFYLKQGSILRKIAWNQREIS